jgi:predicted GNAT family N-acyltransferase
MKRKDKTFEHLWKLENKIFKKEDRSTKKDLKEIYDCRELLIINDYGYAVCSPLEENKKNKIVKEERKHYGKKDTTYIFSIGIVPEERGQGHGREMLKELIMFSTKPRIALDTTSEVMKKMCLEIGFKELSETYLVFEKRPSILTQK